MTEERRGDFDSACGSAEKSTVVVLIFNKILLLWLFDLFGNIHSYQTHNPETQQNKSKRGRKTNKLKHGTHYYGFHFQLNIATSVSASSRTCISLPESETHIFIYTNINISQCSHQYKYTSMFLVFR